MALKENNNLKILIKGIGGHISTEVQFEKKNILTSKFKTLFSNFLDSFKEMNSILSNSPDKNLILIEDINKSFSSFVREAENIDSENSVNYTNIERQLKRLSNFLSKLLGPTNKNHAIMVTIDNLCSELYATTRFLHDVVNIEKKNLKDESQSYSTIKEYQKIANEFSNRYPRYNGFKIEVKTYKEEFDIQIVTTNQVSNPRILRDTTQKLHNELDEYLHWELQKLDQTTNVSIVSSNGMISVELRDNDEIEDEEEEDY